MTRPDVIVVRGAPDDDELAALVAVLAAFEAQAASAAQDPGPANGRWATGPSRPAYRPPGAWNTVAPKKR
jgi:hypothetical protein